MNDYPLSGLRVIDCSTYISGPAADAMLGDFGAEVIKVERPPYGDPYRYMSQIPAMPTCDLNYCWILDGRNKKSLALNLGADAGRDILLKLVKSADVFITNLQPVSLANLHLSFDDLRIVNERLIYALVTGYGEKGKDANLPGYDLTAFWARSGIMAELPAAGAEACLSLPGIGDHPTGVALFGGILLALYQRQITGKGQKISTSLMANGAWSNSCFIQAALCGAEFPPRPGRTTTTNPLANHYFSRDGQRLQLCLLDPIKDWSRLCHAVKRPELLQDPRFATPQGRSENAKALVAILDAAFAEREISEWGETFAEHDVIWSSVPTAQMVAVDPQMHDNGLLPAIVESQLRTVANPLQLDGVTAVPPHLAPEIGEHTEEILLALGYSHDEIAEMESSRLVKVGRPAPSQTITPKRKA